MKYYTCNRSKNGISKKLKTLELISVDKIDSQFVNLNEEKPDVYNLPEIIYITQTYHIYESKLNYL